MQFTSREVVAACADLARKNVGSDIPKPAKAPTRKKLRREIPSHVRAKPQSRSSMAVSR
jgi:hypothetical protein